MMAEEAVITEEVTTEETEEVTSEANDNWRSVIQDEKLRKHAENFASVEELTKAHLGYRKDLSTAIIPLGKNPTDEQITAYRKAAGIPEAVDGYEFSVPEGREPTETDKALQSNLAETYHKLNINSDQAKGLSEWWNEAQSAALKAQIDGDKEFAEQSMAALRKEWPGTEFDTNKAIADLAAVKIFGDQLDEVRNIETNDGRFVLDHPAFLKMLAQYGREMQEGNLGGNLTEGDVSSVEGQISELDKQINEARWAGDPAKANDLYIKQQDLYRKIYGGDPIVGSEGRTA